MRYDLHVHSSLSDGSLPKLQLLRQANEMKLEYIAFTDHNFVSESLALQKDYEAVYGTKGRTNIIDGVELDCYFQNFKLHILAYNIFNYEHISSILGTIKNKNKSLIEILINNIFREYGIIISSESLEKGDNKREIVSLLMKNGFGDDPHVVADKYTSVHSKCYVKMAYPEFEKLCQLLKNNCQYLILAHPETLNISLEELDKLLQKLREIGLDGIEVLNLKKNSTYSTKQLAHLSKKNDLLCSCGSDFHDTKDILGIENDLSKKLIMRMK